MQCITQSFLSLSTAHAHPASPPCRVPLNSPQPHKTCTSCACVRRSWPPTHHYTCLSDALITSCMHAAKLMCVTFVNMHTPSSATLDMRNSPRCPRLFAAQNPRAHSSYVLFFFACVGASSAPIQYSMHSHTIAHACGRCAAFPHVHKTM